MKHFITYVTSYQPQHGWKNKLNQNCWPIQSFIPSNFNTQQDVAELLHFVLDKLKGISITASHLVCNIQKTTVSGNTCFCSSVSEENLDIVTLPVSADIQASMNQFLKLEILTSQNKWFLPSCNLLCESSRETCIMNSAPILIIQVWWFSTN